MLGSDARLVRLDMSEYQLPGASQRLLEVGGSGDGYSLAARVR
jgi:ATP-dependent Clp protease ATP-binding subunit ClpA